MAARKYRFERLTPIDNMDLNVYEVITIGCRKAIMIYPNL